MRKILVAAVISVVALSYSGAPQVVGAAVSTTVGLGVTILTAVGDGLTGVFGGGGSAPAPTGNIQTLPDGTSVEVPPGFTLVDPATGAPVE